MTPNNIIRSIHLATVSSELIDSLVEHCEVVAAPVSPSAHVERLFWEPSTDEKESRVLEDSENTFLTEIKSSSVPLQNRESAGVEVSGTIHVKHEIPRVCVQEVNGTVSKCLEEPTKDACISNWTRVDRAFRREQGVIGQKNPGLPAQNPYPLGSSNTDDRKSDQALKLVDTAMQLDILRASLENPVTKDIRKDS